MEAIIDLGVFGAKTLLVVVGIIAVLLTVIAAAAKAKLQGRGFKVKHLNKKFQEQSEQLAEMAFDKKELKAYQKKAKALEKAKDSTPAKKAFVLEFEGNVKAEAVDQLREEISLILSSPVPCSEVILKLESPGGMVHAYGLAASQLIRLKNAGIPLTICVDKVAASGGYMMSCIADKIIAAPFAIVGSIGVVAQVPNVNKLLKKNNIDYEEITAGEYKRTISILGEITEKGREKFTQEINETHQLFKTWVSTYRPQLDTTQVATGEHWYGQQAIDKKLVDEIMTSDEYILSKTKEFDVYSLKLSTKKKLQERLEEAVSIWAEKTLPRWVLTWQQQRWY